MFGEVVVAVLNNPEKTATFSLDTRLNQINEATKGIKDVHIISFEGLTVSCAAEMKCSIILRGLRALSDFEYELQIAHTNKTLGEQFETIFLATSAQHSFLSSSVVKEVAQFGGDVSHMVPSIVAKDLKHLYT